MMPKTIAITGASGFIGGAIVRHFHRLGWLILAFGRRDNPDLPVGIKYQQWDIANGTIQIEEPVDVVVHSAAMVGDSGKYEDFLKANVNGTQNVLDSFRSAGQFIHISSSSVYNPFAEKINISEDFPYGTQYLNAYSETKMLSEKVILADARSNKVIVRPRAIYGEGDTTLLPRLLRLHRGKYMLGFGDGTNEISITYIGNLCLAIERISERYFESEIFNIADNQSVTQREVLERITKFMGWEFHPLFIPRPIANSIAKISDFARIFGIPTRLSTYAVHNLAENFTLNISKAQQMIGYDGDVPDNDKFF